MIIKEVWKWEQEHSHTGYCDVIYCIVMKNSQENEEIEEKMRINGWIEWGGWSIIGAERDEKSKHDLINKKIARNTRYSPSDPDWKKQWIIMSKANYGSWWKMWSLLWCEFERMHNIVPCMKIFITCPQDSYLIPTAYHIS